MLSFAVANVLTGRASAVDKLLRGAPFVALLDLGRYVVEDRILPAYRAAPRPRRRRALTRALTSSFSEGGVPTWAGDRRRPGNLQARDPCLLWSGWPKHGTAEKVDRDGDGEIDVPAAVGAVAGMSDLEQPKKRSLEFRREVPPTAQGARGSAGWAALVALTNVAPVVCRPAAAMQRTALEQKAGDRPQRPERQQRRNLGQPRCIAPHRLHHASEGE
jgi:hypothetical protein